MNEKIAAPHADDVAVDDFAAAMRAKLAASREKGRGGWQTASAAHLTFLLLEHLEKGDPVDVANFAMMLHQNGQAIDGVVVQAYRKSASPVQGIRF
ncbi:hypothetical protein LDB30_06080 [Acidithiobacillus ferrooxidans]|nr:hypothetical protein LDB30_06080 [Acidithiobacillus ferrooxidans]